MFTSQVSGESLGRPPSVGSWLHAGKNSRASPSKVKAGLFRDTHSIERMRSISESESSPGRNTLHRQSVGHLRR